jgi:hypothetical protein
MKRTSLPLLVMLLCLPLLCSAQKKMKTTDYQGKMKTKSMPAWAPAHRYMGDKHVYFRDYYTFYDPARGYVYWNNGRWTTSTDVPAYLNSVDLNAARMELLDDNVEIHPETKIKVYREKYPAERVKVTVPIPD